ncbi:MAG: aldolase catalytic domain-containing protein [Bacillota bacterium]|nr:aldolase catalytic domain-containing protein [Bacillota bacterium]
MNHVKLLDCTLRDGAYLVDKKFGINVINGIINGLLEAKVDIIEIGFLQDEGAEVGKTIFRNSMEAARFVPSKKGDTIFTVLADYSRYSITNLDKYTGVSFDGVRACFFKQERFDAFDFFRSIKDKGYKLFIQPVDILGYTDSELLEFITIINDIEPYCFSIVDTFGSMYEDDLQRIFSLIDHNLSSNCRIGFHSHNNLQMSCALSQAFVRMTFGKRNAIVDSTISGMGRGAGNTPTELISQYLVSQWGYSYDIDSILDLIDSYMDNLRTKCTWGYSTPFFIAGMYNAHVNNVTYLMQKNSVRSKDIRFILNSIDASTRKRYDYNLLESAYLHQTTTNIDDSLAINRLKNELGGRNIAVIAPGGSIKAAMDTIIRYIEQHNAIVISINFLPNAVRSDYLYMNNIKRYSNWPDLSKIDIKRIFTSNIMQEAKNQEYIISFNRLIKCGWEHMDNSTIMLLRLLDQIDVASIGIAGLDGFTYGNSGIKNYADGDMELASITENPMELNREIETMLNDFMKTKRKTLSINFIT